MLSDLAMAETYTNWDVPPENALVEPLKGVLSVYGESTTVKMTQIA
jgi:hypothetical protein